MTLLPECASPVGRTSRAIGPWWSLHPFEMGNWEERAVAGLCLVRTRDSPDEFVWPAWLEVTDLLMSDSEENVAKNVRTLLPQYVWFRPASGDDNLANGRRANREYRRASQCAATIPFRSPDCVRNQLPGRTSASLHRGLPGGISHRRNSQFARELEVNAPTSFDSNLA